MTDEPALLAAVATDPENDAPRLVYADWLDDRGEHARAELIRVQCALEPVRGRYDLPHAAALHEREDELLDDRRGEDEEWLTGLFGHDASSPYSPLLYRRGFVHQVRLPAPAWVEHGAAFRERCPLVRSLRVHRLNGWGERLARCESLTGLTELDLACWCRQITDVHLLSSSPHLSGIESLRLWLQNRLQFEWAIILGRRLPALLRTQIVDMTATCLGRELLDWFSPTLNDPATRVRPTVEDRSDWLFPFAADFSPNHYVGRLGDGRLFFGFCNEYYPQAGLRGLTFASDGTPGDRLDLPLPELPPNQSLWEVEAQLAIRRHLYERAGFEAAAIRVKPFRFDGLAEGDGFGTPAWWPADDIEGFGEPDDPANWPPEHQTEFHGNGVEAARKWDEREFVYDWGKEWWCDKTGQVQST